MSALPGEYRLKTQFSHGRDAESRAEVHYGVETPVFEPTSIAVTEEPDQQFCIEIDADRLQRARAVYSGRLERFRNLLRRK